MLMGAHPGAGGAARSYHFYGAHQRINSNRIQRPSCQSFFRTLLGQEWANVWLESRLSHRIRWSSSGKSSSKSWPPMPKADSWFDIGNACPRKGTLLRVLLSKHETVPWEIVLLRSWHEW